MENIIKKIIGDINLEFLNNNLEINNFLKIENVGNVMEEIVGKEIEVEKIFIFDNGEGENLLEKILFDS